MRRDLKKADLENEKRRRGKNDLFQRHIGNFVCCHALEMASGCAVGVYVKFADWFLINQNAHRKLVTFQTCRTGRRR